MRRHRRRPIRRTASGIEVALPAWVTSTLAAAVHQVRRDVSTPGTAAVRRLLAPMDESASDDDPIVTLTRQHELDNVLACMAATVDRRVLSDAEAETWVEALGLLLAARAAALGVRTDEERRSVGRRDEAFLQVVYAVQVGLMESLAAPPED